MRHEQDKCHLRVTETDRKPLAVQTHVAPTALTIESRFGRELRAFCRRMVFDEGRAEEIVQDVLLAYVRNPPADAPLPAMELSGKGRERAEPSRLRGWLYRVAHNRCTDVLRKMRPAERLSAVFDSRQHRAIGARGLTSGPATKVARIEQAELIQAAVDELEEPLRIVVILRYYQQLPREEIAVVLGLQMGGVKDRLRKALAQMRERFAAWDPRTNPS